MCHTWYDRDLKKKIAYSAPGPRNWKCQMTSTSEVNDIFKELRSVRKKCPKNIMFSHLNINSLRNKFYKLSDLFSSMLVDILFITETKLDPSFSLAQFDVPNYRSFRKDRTGRGGGILTCQI